MTTIFHPFNPTTRPADQIPTWQLLKTFPPEIPRVDWLCVKPFDYHEGLVTAWQSPGDLIVIEHDNVPTLDQISDMLRCNEACCTTPYWVGPPSTGQTGSIVSVNSLNNPPITSISRSGHQPNGYTMVRADHSSIGCIKLSAAWRRLVGLPTREVWFAVENSVNIRVAESGQTWHVHWPMCRHNHGTGE